VTVLVVGATGSIGHLVVEEGLRYGHSVRALVRSEAKARQLPAETHVVIGDVTPTLSRLQWTAQTPSCSRWDLTGPESSALRTSTTAAYATS